MSPIHFHTALGGSILRLWSAPSPRAYSWSGVTLFSFHSASRIHPVPSARPFSKGLLMERSSLFSFHSASRIHPAPLEHPFSKGLLMEQIHSLFLLYRFEESILRLWRGPSPRAYSWSGVTLFSFYTASRNPSCAFSAVLFQGPTHGADSLFFPFIPLRGIILRLWRAPSSRGYSISKTPFFHLTPVTSHQSLVTKKEKSQLALTLFRDRVSSRKADIGHCFFLPPR